MERKPVAAHHVVTILAVRDVDTSVRFYREAFGWKMRNESPGFVEFELPDGQGIGLFERRAFADNTRQIPEPTPRGALTGTELYFHCEDLDDVVGRLDEIGARKLSDLAVRHWGDETAYYADPDGNVLAIAKPCVANSQRK